MANIVLAGINVFRNRGTEALAVSNVQNLHKALPGSHIVLPTRDLDEAKYSFADGSAEIVPDQAWAPPVTAPIYEKMLFRAKRRLRRDILGRMQAQEKALSKADLVVVSGGDTFSSDYDVMERYLRQLDQPLSQNIPVYFLAHSIGPFKSDAEIASFMQQAPKCTFTVREKISETYLLETLGLSRDRVTLTADPAFLLGVPDAVRTQMLEDYDLEPGAYAVGACSRSISGFTGITHEDHVKGWVEAAKALMDRAGKLVLVPHVQMREAHQDDLALAREIRAALNDDPRCVVMDKSLHTSVEFKAVLGQAVFAVAERTHGAIGAMSSGVPTLSVGYSIKAEGVLRQLVLDDEALVQTSLIPAPEFNGDYAARAVANAWDVQDAFRAQLTANLPAVKERAGLNYEIAKGLVAP